MVWFSVQQWIVILFSSGLSVSMFASFQFTGGNQGVHVVVNQQIEEWGWGRETGKHRKISDCERTASLGVVNIYSFLTLRILSV